eukprot:TRINITY_DN3234_c0_g1_i2.p1 TRINITY_DN3234_c0_g1~~TRINITY_DN3234_c0_g1_i2.p1  ORF type:complete len:283 (+),score=-32.49 TRINITY_DN3234_c0_g1_i2:1167-2015(+)
MGIASTPSALRVIIPARLASQRLPRKPLLMCAGKTLLQHVYEKAQALCPDSIVIATDHPEVIQVATQFGASTCLTSAAHTTGTDRAAEVCKKLAYSEEDIIIVLQADEPLMPLATLQVLSEYLQHHPEYVVATIGDELTSPQELFDPNIVKVVLDKAHCALYFSRAPIPWDRARFSSQKYLVDVNMTATGTMSGVGVQDISALRIAPGYLRHIGLYAYRAAFLQTYVDWPVAPLESLEYLEQLRILWHGVQLPVLQSPCSVPVGVDTPADFTKIEQLFASLS